MSGCRVSVCEGDRVQRCNRSAVIEVLVTMPVVHDFDTRLVPHTVAIQSILLCQKHRDWQHAIDVKAADLEDVA